jgi:epoxyqueuosine reductase
MDVLVPVTKMIEDFLDSPENLTGPGGAERLWGRPLVGWARGDDPLWERISEHIGPFYWTPREAFRAAHPDLQPEPADLAVISWVLPQTEATKADNRAAERLPAERWVRAKHEGEAVNGGLRAHVVGRLSAAGVAAMAPLLSPAYFESVSPVWGRVSRWSERHAAHVAGLGTFGLCDGLIAAVGKAHRCGSVVALLEVPPAERAYEGIHDHCLFYADGSCGLCIDRCPPGALSESGHDKGRCDAYLEKMSSEYVEARFGFRTGVCGLCQTGVPCESGIPRSAG